MPELLKKAYRDELVTWIGRPCHFRLLYKISRDGCSAQTFHQKCDGQGPTVTVLYNTNNTIFGGYLSQSWNSDGSYIDDKSAFLFRLQYNGVSNPLQFPIKRIKNVRHDINEFSCYTGLPQQVFVVDCNNAGYGDSNKGPYFGNGDLKTFSGVIKRSRNCFPLNGSVENLGNTYKLQLHHQQQLASDRS